MEWQAVPESMVYARGVDARRDVASKDVCHADSLGLRRASAVALDS